MTDVTAAEELARWCAANGVARLFGVPGGGSSLDIIAAAGRRGIPFVLARTEAAAMVMAATTAELTGSPGVVLVTRGPGLAAALNGLAHATLDRSPVLLVSDGFTEAQRRFVTHQVLDQTALAAPLVRAAAVTDGHDIGACLATLTGAMLGPCRGPALLELSDEAARKPALPAPAAPPTPLPPPREERLAAARALLGQARRPVIIAGLEANGAAAETRALAQAVGAPVLVTYKAKGVVADDDPLFAGVFTGGAAEACAAAGLAPRAAVDAGAHMFSATSFWPGRAPHGVLISNGLATMGFALPAGIAAALTEPDRPVLAFTGDGGLLMCLGELATAAAVRTRLVVIVFNDAGLSLIALKKAGRAVPEESLAWAPPGFADVARGLGCAGVTVETEDAYRAALTTALATDGPTVIDVRIDPTGYPAQMAAARGWIGGCSSINMCA